MNTPNIDTIAAAGIELDRFYVNASCSPTRASLLTGQWATTHGVTFPVHKDMEGGLPLEHTLLPQYLKKAGYQTHLIGKWHLGLQQREYTPLARGFDSFYGFLGGGIGYYDHVFSGGLDWQRDGVSLEEEGRMSFLQMVASMDMAVGKVVDKLRSDSLLDNTLIIFASDNGGQISLPFLVTYMIPQLKDGYGNNMPLREGRGRYLMAACVCLRQSGGPDGSNLPRHRPSPYTLSICYQHWLTPSASNWTPATLMA